MGLIRFKKNFLLLLVIATSFGPGTKDADAESSSSTRYIVELRSSENPDRFAKAEKISKRRSFRKALNGFSATLSAAEVQKLNTNKRVTRIVKDEIISLHAETLQVSTSQWFYGTNLDLLDQRSSIRDGLYRFQTSGRGVTIYVVDTGLHPENPYFAGRARVGFRSNPRDTSNDCSGHGTSVAAAAAGVTLGVANSSKIVGVKVFNAGVMNCASTYTSDIIAGLEWILLNRTGPAVVNLSLGASAWSSSISPLEVAVEKLIAAGITVVVAAGNGGTDGCGELMVRRKIAISVGALNIPQPRQAAPYSNYGSCVTMWAPTDQMELPSSSGWGRINRRGTSFSSPQVAGIAAQLLEAAPALSHQQVKDTLLAAATRQTITQPNGQSVAAAIAYNGEEFLPHYGAQYHFAEGVYAPGWDTHWYFQNNMSYPTRVRVTILGEVFGPQTREYVVQAHGQIGIPSEILTGHQSYGAIVDSVDINNPGGITINRYVLRPGIAVVSHTNQPVPLRNSRTLYPCNMSGGAHTYIAISNPNSAGVTTVYSSNTGSGNLYVPARSRRTAYLPGDPTVAVSSVYSNAGGIAVEKVVYDSTMTRGALCPGS